MIGLSSCKIGLSYFFQNNEDAQLWSKALLLDVHPSSCITLCWLKRIDWKICIFGPKSMWLKSIDPQNGRFKAKHVKRIKLKDQEIAESWPTHNPKKNHTNKHNPPNKRSKYPRIPTLPASIGRNGTDMLAGLNRGPAQTASQLAICRCPIWLWIKNHGTLASEH